MTRETKVGLLVGLGIILLVGIIVSDHLSVAQRQNAADFTGLTSSPNQTSGRGSQADPGMGSRVGAVIRRITTPGANSSDPQHPQDADRSASGLQTAGQGGTPLPLPADAQPTETPRRGYGPISPDPDGRDTDGRFAGNRETPPVITFGAKPVVRSGPGASGQAKSETRAARFVAPAASVVTYEPREMAPQPIVHYVKEGESLWQIAHRYYDNGEYWQTIARANPKAVLPSGGVRQGVRLVIPNKAGLVNAAVVSTGRAASIQPSSTDTQTPPVIETTTPDPRVSRGVITVRGGDTLSGLAQAHLGSSGRWRELYEANRDQLDQPHEVYVGMKLRLPAGHGGGRRGNSETSGSRSGGGTLRGGYVVKSNDSLSSIAADQLGDAGRWEQIYKANKGWLDHPDDIRVGQKLIIPAR